ncbi:hypothetical protein [Nocardia sienata]|uniref:hypothetical protein n=1 Tax=Nocardia sienata TaxID=248552 RepID=UPI000A44322E|nr:hypothetical protein [Nocardia sienata]
MNALIILAVALVAVGLLITVVLWLRAPHSAESEYVTVAELRARLENEQERGEEEEPEERGEEVAAEEADGDEPETGGTGAGPEPAAEAGRPAASVVTPPTSTGSGSDTPPAAESAPDTGIAGPEPSHRPTKQPRDEQPPKAGGEPTAGTADEPPAGEPGPDH